MADAKRQVALRPPDLARQDRSHLEAREREGHLRKEVDPLPVPCEAKIERSRRTLPHPHKHGGCRQWRRTARRCRRAEVVEPFAELEPDHVRADRTTSATMASPNTKVRLSARWTHRDPNAYTVMLADESSALVKVNAKPSQ